MRETNVARIKMILVKPEWHGEELSVFSSTLNSYTLCPKRLLRKGVTRASTEGR